MNQPTTATSFNTFPSLGQPRIYGLWSLLALAAAATLLATQVQAQPAEPAAAASATSAESTTAAKYDPKDLERAFNFMDKTSDGKVSRDEASNFRGVSRHFDQADLNKDNFLSREEFDNAMNRSKAH
jgi:hypothetical protein